MLPRAFEGIAYAAAVSGGMTDEEMRERLALLRLEHRDLDIAIAALTEKDGPDQLQVARLKKRKLKLKDQMTMFEDYLIPDIIA